jgi:hypothetical protein
MQRSFGGAACEAVAGGAGEGRLIAVGVDGLGEDSVGGLIQIDSLDRRTPLAQAGRAGGDRLCRFFERL